VYEYKILPHFKFHKVEQQNYSAYGINILLSNGFYTPIQTKI